MRIDFDDGSYVEFRKSDDKYLIIVSAKDAQNSLKRITNAAEISVEELNSLIKSIS